MRRRITTTWHCTGKDFPVSSLMRLAVAYPKGFCKALAATLPRFQARFTTRRPATNLLAPASSRKR